MLEKCCLSFGLEYSYASCSFFSSFYANLKNCWYWTKSDIDLSFCQGSKTTFFLAETDSCSQERF